MKKLLLYVIVSGLFITQGIAQTLSLKFNENGKFKIVQFTDLHWNPRSAKCAVTTATIKHVLETEKPDLAILTGDVVTSRPAEEGWQAVIKIFEEAKIPFAVTMGNHDAEQGYTRETIYDWLGKSPCFLGEKGPKDLSGCGNYVIEVQGNHSSTAALLYCLDSHDYPENTRKYGHYDRIRYDQIEWYRRKSEEFAKNNGNKPIPALAFFHIPTLEYYNIVGRNTTIGHNNEVISSPNINSGLFSSIVDRGDVMGIFTGHDHDNDYIGLNYGVALGFGRTTGADARGKLERGGRIIELYEDQFKFDTWIRTTKGTELAYYYPSGISSLDEESLAYLPAKNVKPLKQGVSYIYYEGKYQSTGDLSPATEKKRGTFRNFTIKDALQKDYFGYEFNTLIRIPEKGIYSFYTYSDDGSKLFVDGNVIVDNDGSREAQLVTGKVALDAGFHELKVLYFEDYMGEELEVGIIGRNMPEMIIPDEMLFLPE